MSKLFYSLTLIVFSLATQAQKQYPDVIFETNMGTLKISLYDNTFRHSENFIKLVNEGYYNGQLFHRVINNFMIQAGDDQSIDADPGIPLGRGGKTYTIPAEIFPEYYHKKGALAAARQPDNINPKRESSGSQFYLVQGTVLTTEQLKLIEQRYNHPPFTEEQIEAYTTIGGTPHLDYTYTVFGMVTEGLDVLDKICAVDTDKRDRPIKDVKIIKAYTVKNK